MKKYFLIYKFEIMSNLQYISNLVTGFIGFCMLILIFFNLWNYLYADPGQVINGYSMNQMIWYVIVTEILWLSVSGRSLSRQISNDVRSGNVAYNINKPYNYVLYSTFSSLGRATIKFVILMFIGGILGFVFLKGFPNINIFKFLVVFISMILAMIINTLLVVFVGLISFYIEDANPLYWLYSKLILILGTIFPIEFFPKFLQPIVTCSPIYVVSYGPAKLFVNFNWALAGQVICAQILYLGFAYLICSLLYKKGVRKLNVNGG